MDKTTKGKLICLEGSDGSGKSTQITLICNYFNKNNITFKYLHFPMYGDNEFSEVISSFLRGDFGKSNEVNPYFAANIYAMDQFLFLPKLKRYLEEYDVVLLDRYVFSNIAYQGAKFGNDTKENNDIKEWISNFQWGFLDMPYPNLNIFLNVPIEISKQRLLQRKEADEREYLKGKEDIHEKDLELQERVNYNYLKEFTCTSNCVIINCAKLSSDTLSDGTITDVCWKSLSPEEIYESYIPHIYKVINE